MQERDEQANQSFIIAMSMWKMFNPWLMNKKVGSCAGCSDGENKINLSTNVVQNCQNHVLFIFVVFCDKSIDANSGCDSLFLLNVWKERWIWMHLQLRV